MLFKSLLGSAALAPALETKVAALARALDDIAERHAAATLTSTLSDADMVITHVILRRSLNISIVAADTDTTSVEAIALLKAVHDKYQYVIKARSDTAELPRFALPADWSDDDVRDYLRAFKVPHRHAAGAATGDALWQNMSGATAWVL